MLKRYKSMMQTQNNLYPVFLKLENLHLLIVGGGFVGTEKMNSVMNCSPDAKVTVVAKEISDEIKQMAEGNSNIVLLQKPFEENDLDGKDLIIAATADKQLNVEVKRIAEKKGILANIADTPELCDFYLSSIVNKGHLKIAVSTNGKSPTIAKRIKELLNDSIPGEMDNVLENMSTIRKQLNGNFQQKVKKLDHITQVLVNNHPAQKKEPNWKRIATYCIAAFGFMILGHAVFSVIPFPAIQEVGKKMYSQLDYHFPLFILAGFLAQMVDGSLGMGYGVTSATCLITMGVNPVSVSASIHTAEMFTTGASGYSHYKFGNVNKKLFKYLVIPGVIGSILGALMLVWLGEKYGKWLMPLIACYAFFLGVKILRKAFTTAAANKKVKRVGWLAAAGGFFDSFGGGGWGPIVTSTLISKGRSPRFTVGTVSLTEFFITLASAFTFFATTGISHWTVIIGLLIGGVIASPIAAKLAGKLPRKTMLIGVGAIVMIWSVRLIVKSIM